MRFLIIVSGWNCEPYVKECIESIKAQTYKDFDVVIIDDASTDNTWNEILKYTDSKWTIHRNTENMGGFFNFNDWTRECLDYDIATPLCLDDKLKPNALERIIKEYDNGAWMTYGTWINKQGKVFTDLYYSEEIHFNRDYRKDKFRCTGIRTYYKKLYEKTQTYQMCDIEKRHYYDLEYTWQMMEMCGKDRIGVVSEPTYEYNNTNPNNTFKLYGRERVVYNQIANRPKKELLEKL